MKKKPVARPQIQIGDTFTIAGVNRGAKGQLVIDGVNPKTKRKCRAVGLMNYKVTARVE